MSVTYAERRRRSRRSTEPAWALKKSRAAGVDRPSARGGAASGKSTPLCRAMSNKPTYQGPREESARTPSSPAAAVVFAVEDDMSDSGLDGVAGLPLKGRRQRDVQARCLGSDRPSPLSAQNSCSVRVDYEGSDGVEADLSDLERQVTGRGQRERESNDKEWESRGVVGGGRGSWVWGVIRGTRYLDMVLKLR